MLLGLIVWIRVHCNGSCWLCGPAPTLGVRFLLPSSWGTQPVLPGLAQRRRAVSSACPPGSHTNPAPAASHPCQLVDFQLADSIIGQSWENYDIWWETGPYGWVWAHNKTSQSHMAQDRFQTPPDPQKGQHKSAKDPTIYVLVRTLSIIRAARLSCEEPSNDTYSFSLSSGHSRAPPSRHGVRADFPP